MNVPQTDAPTHPGAPLQCELALLERSSKGKTLARDLRNRNESEVKVSPQQVDLVQKTWRLVQPIGDTAAELFYGKLFSLDPEVRPLFKNDLRDQGRNFTAMISVAVHWLGRPEKILLAIQQLGRRHAAYGVEPRHYEIVATALLWMLEKCLGEAFTAEARRAWSAAYNMLAEAMQQAAGHVSA
jgi:hemoglobin-like flavoprotein